MNSTVQKVIVVVALALFPVLMGLIPAWVGFLQNTGSTLGTSMFYSVGLDNFLNGYLTPEGVAATNYYAKAFTWCWYVPLVALALLYVVVDSVRMRTIFHWLAFWLGAAIVCAVRAYTEVSAARAENIQLDEVVDSGVIIGWALLNLLVALVLGLILSYFLSRVSLNARHTPLAGKY